MITSNIATVGAATADSAAAAAQISPLRASFWRHYLTQLRPYLFFVSGSSALLGAALAEPASGSSRLVLALAPLFISYGLGQSITDAFQLDTDRISASYRPLSRGLISRAALLSVSCLLLALSALLLALIDPWTIALAALAVVGLFAYSPLKRRFWAGPPCNAAVVALLVPIGALAAGSGASRLWQLGQLLPAMLSVFFSYSVFVVIGYFKDVRADARTGYQTIVVRFGRRAALLVSAVCSAAAVGSSLWVLVGRDAWPSQFSSSWLGYGLWLLGLLELFGAHLRAARVQRDEQAYPAVAASVRGHVQLQLGTVALLRPSWAVAALLLSIAAAVALAARPCREQV